MQKRRVLSITAKQKGFTLIELLVAITLMAVMAGLGWRGLDGLMRSRDINQTRVDQTAIMQTVLAQWRSDLDHMTSVPSISDAGLAWDGQTLRVTRRASTPLLDGSDAGLWVVAWTRRDGLGGAGNLPRSKTDAVCSKHGRAQSVGAKTPLRMTKILKLHWWLSTNGKLATFAAIHGLIRFRVRV